jgi:hypothetical protein
MAGLLAFLSFSESNFSKKLRGQMKAYDKTNHGLRNYEQIGWWDWYVRDGYKMPLGIHKLEFILLFLPIMNVVVVLWVILRFFGVFLYNKSNWSKDEET